MRFLLDVNLLLAIGLAEHEHHARAAAWARDTASGEMLTCAITEIGFVRVASQAAVYGYAVSDAKQLLQRLRAAAAGPGGNDAGAPAPRFRFVGDAVPADSLPGWVRGAKQVTDGHLTALAAAHGAKLATLDAGIPGAYRIR